MRPSPAASINRLAIHKAATTRAVSGLQRPPDGQPTGAGERTAAAHSSWGCPGALETPGPELEGKVNALCPRELAEDADGGGSFRARSQSPAEADAAGSQSCIALTHPSSPQQEDPDAYPDVEGHDPSKTRPIDPGSRRTRWEKELQLRQTKQWKLAFVTYTPPAVRHHSTKLRS